MNVLEEEEPEEEPEAIHHQEEEEQEGRIQERCLWSLQAIFTHLRLGQAAQGVFSMEGQEVLHSLMKMEQTDVLHKVEPAGYLLQTIFRLERQVQVHLLHLSAQMNMLGEADQMVRHPTAAQVGVPEGEVMQGQPAWPEADQREDPPEPILQAMGQTVRKQTVRMG